MPNLISRIVDPWYPSSAIGLEKGIVSVVHLERARGRSCAIRNAATFNISDSLIQPSFDETNIQNPAQVADVLRQLVGSVGLLKQKRWSIALPEASARTQVLTLEGQTQSGAEVQEVLKWKIERGFGAELAELSVAKERLPKDAQGRDRYLAIAVRRSVLNEYEKVFESSGWRAGLILPRHIGEAQWLIRNGTAGDALLLSGSDTGFTAVIFRGKQPLIVRTVSCTPEECEDELYRLLLFYRDRRADGPEAGATLSRLMVLGDGLRKERVGEIVNETTGGDLRVLEAEDLGLQLPTRELNFDAIAAPAGLATMSW
jgi:Tfp pilus assembly PilM family ATPase